MDGPDRRMGGIEAIHTCHLVPMHDSAAEEGGKQPTSNEAVMRECIFVQKLHDAKKSQSRDDGASWRESAIHMRRRSMTRRNFSAACTLACAQQQQQHCCYNALSRLDGRPIPRIPGWQRRQSVGNNTNVEPRWHVRHAVPCRGRPRHIASACFRPRRFCWGFKGHQHQPTTRGAP